MATLELPRTPRSRAPRPPAAARARGAVSRIWGRLRAGLPATVDMARLVVSRLAGVRHSLLTVAGFSFLASASFQVSAAVGLACTGVLVLAFDLVTGDTPDGRR